MGMAQEKMQELRELCESGCTDSDIEDFCEENAISEKEAFHLIATWSAPECCRKCKHVDFYNSMYPCSVCSRPLKDMYEEYEEE